MDLTGGTELPLPERRSYLGALLTVGALGLWITHIVVLTLASFAKVVLTFEILYRSSAACRPKF